MSGLKSSGQITKVLRTTVGHFKNKLGIEREEVKIVFNDNSRWKIVIVTLKTIRDFEERTSTQELLDKSRKIESIRRLITNINVTTFNIKQCCHLRLKSI